MSTQEDTIRRRTFTWGDAALAANAVRTMDGMEFLRAIRDGTLPHPPMLDLMGMEAVEFVEGRAVFAIAPQEYHYNTIGSAHGGLACTLLDSAMGCAVHTLLPKGAGYTTLELKVNLVRPLKVETGRVLCTGTVIHLGRRIATAEGKITDPAGTIYAHATTTCMIFRDGQP